jgi:hypothetical protein
MKKTLLLIAAILLSGCSIFKSGNDITDKKITSFSFNYPKEKVESALLSVLESEGYKVRQNDIATGEFTTDTKKIKDVDDIYATLKSMSELPKSPLSEYLSGAYYLFVKITPDNNKTTISLKNNIEAMERGKYNRSIKIASNGQKEKELLAKILKVLK